MKRLIVGLLLLGMCGTTEASGERERIAVLVSRVRWGISKRKKSPDTPPNVQVINAGRGAGAAPDPRVEELQEQIRQLKQTMESLKPVPPPAEEPPADEPTTVPVRRAIAPIGPNTIELPTFSFSTESMMSMEDEPYLVVCATQDSCPQCVAAEKKIQKGDHRIKVEFVNIDKPKPDWMDAKWWGTLRLVRKTPAYTWQDDNGKVFVAYGVGQTKDSIVKEIETPTHKYKPPSKRRYQAMGAAGSFHGQEFIEQVNEWIRSHVGEGVEMRADWDRTGPQVLSLMFAGKPWPMLQLFGQSGRIALSAKGAVNLPVDAVGFSYRVNGNDLTIDPEVMTLKEMAKALGLSEDETQNGMSSAPGMDPISTAWTVLQIVRMVWAIAHPVADLRLGGNVSATAVLRGDTLTVKFKNMPSIRLVWLFTFNLGVDQVTITPQNVNLHFVGSRWITSRDFKVTSAASASPFSEGKPLPRDPEVQPRRCIPSGPTRHSLPRGWHSHRCNVDGRIWSHSNSSYGVVADHMCPACGRIQWIQYVAGGNFLGSDRDVAEVVVDCVGDDDHWSGW